MHCRVEENSLTDTEKKSLKILFHYVAFVVSDKNHLDL